VVAIEIATLGFGIDAALANGGWLPDRVRWSAVQAALGQSQKITLRLFST
jgi:hypothetical protein